MNSKSGSFAHMFVISAICAAIASQQRVITLVYAVVDPLYNMDHDNIPYVLIPWNTRIHEKDLLLRVLYGVAALLAAPGATFLTWSTVHGPQNANPRQVPFAIAGPFGYVRNPHYSSYFVLILALGTF